MRKHLTQPAMALNAVGTEPYFQMENNYEVPATHTPQQIFQWVHDYALQRPGKKLNAIVIQSHGAGAVTGSFLGKNSLGYGIGIQLGTGILKANVDGLPRDDTVVFSKLRTGDGKPLVGEIYLTGCGVAAVSKFADGNIFCSEVARHSGSLVYASPDTQFAFYLGFNKWREFGVVEFDGVVKCFKPNGSIDPVVAGSGGFGPSGPPIT